MRIRTCNDDLRYYDNVEVDFVDKDTAVWIRVAQ